jgi:hypothetical protein
MRQVFCSSKNYARTCQANAASQVGQSKGTPTGQAKFRQSELRAYKQAPFMMNSPQMTQKFVMSPSRMLPEASASNNCKHKKQGLCVMRPGARQLPEKQLHHTTCKIQRIWLHLWIGCLSQHLLLISLLTAFDFYHCLFWWLYDVGSVPAKW